MADALDKLITLNTAYKWLNGAKTVVTSTKLVMDSAKSVNDMAKDVRKGGKTASVDWRKLEKTLGSNRKELDRLNNYWTKQAKDVQAVANAAWPVVKTDARARFESLIALEKSHGADSQVFKRALDKTIKHLTACRDRVHERATFCAMVAERSTDMHDAFMDANDAIDRTLKLYEVSFVIFIAASGVAAGTAMKNMINIKSSIMNRPKSVARAYASLAGAARAQERRLSVDRAEIDGLLKKLGEMKFIDLVQDARSFLKNLLKAA